MISLLLGLLLCPALLLAPELLRLLIAGRIRPAPSLGSIPTVSRLLSLGSIPAVSRLLSSLGALPAAFLPGISLGVLPGISRLGISLGIAPAVSRLLVPLRGIPAVPRLGAALLALALKDPGLLHIRLARAALGPASLFRLLFHRRAALRAEKIAIL